MAAKNSFHSATAGTHLEQLRAGVLHRGVQHAGGPDGRARGGADHELGPGCREATGPQRGEALVALLGQRRAQCGHRPRPQLAELLQLTCGQPERRRQSDGNKIFWNFLKGFRNFLPAQSL